MLLLAGPELVILYKMQIGLYVPGRTAFVTFCKIAAPCFQIIVTVNIAVKCSSLLLCRYGTAILVCIGLEKVDGFLLVGNVGQAYLLWRALRGIVHKTIG